MRRAWVSNMARQIAERYPQMYIVEVGAGTGGTTKHILDTLGYSFKSYTFTNVSPTFQEKVLSCLEKFADHLEYRTFDIDVNPATQNFKAGGYNLAVAANVLHATADMEKVIHHTRLLLKPGGYSILFNRVEHTTIRTSFLQGGLPGCWCGVESGRPWAPILTLLQWDELLTSRGFVGIETSTKPDALACPGVEFVAQAVNDEFRLLRQPLDQAPPTSFVVDDLALVGTVGPVASNLVRYVRSLIEPCGIFKNVREFHTGRARQQHCSTATQLHRTGLR